VKQRACQKPSGFIYPPNIVLLSPTSLDSNPTECNMHHTSRKDEVDEEELPRFWIFSLLLSNFFMISVTMHTEEVSPRRNSKSGKR